MARGNASEHFTILKEVQLETVARVATGCLVVFLGFLRSKFP